MTTSVDWYGNGLKSVLIVRRTYDFGWSEMDVYNDPAELPPELLDLLSDPDPRELGPGEAWVLGVGPALYPHMPDCVLDGCRCQAERCPHGTSDWTLCPHLREGETVCGR